VKVHFAGPGTVYQQDCSGERSGGGRPNEIVLNRRLSKARKGINIDEIGEGKGLNWKASTLVEEKCGRARIH